MYDTFCIKGYLLAFVCRKYLLYFRHDSRIVSTENWVYPMKMGYILRINGTFGV